MSNHRVPSDEDLVSYLYDEIHKTGGGRGRQATSPVVLLIGECDLYGDKEPWQIWNDHNNGGGGNNFKAAAADGDDDQEGLHLFTKLNNVSLKSSKFRRHVGSGRGTWTGETGGKAVVGGIAEKRLFRYENDRSEHHRKWLLHEHRLLDDDGADYVLCRLKRKIEKRKTRTTLASTGIPTATDLPLSVSKDQERVIKKPRHGADDQSRHLRDDHDQEKVVKKPGLGAGHPRRGQDDDTTSVLQNNMNHADQEQHYLGLKSANITTKNDHGALLNGNITVPISTPSFHDVCEFGELFDSGSDPEVKVISRQEFNDAVAQSSSSSSTFGARNHHVEVEEVKEQYCSYGSDSTDEKLLENFAQELENLLEIGHGNVAESPPPSTTAGRGDQIVSQDIDTAYKLLIDLTDKEELEKLLPINAPLISFSEEEVMNVGTFMHVDYGSKAGANLSQLGCEGAEENNTTMEDDDKHLIGKSFAEQLKDVPLYYNEEENYMMDTLCFFDFY